MRENAQRRKKIEGYEEGFESGGRVMAPEEIQEKTEEMRDKIRELEKDIDMYNTAMGEAEEGEKPKFMAIRDELISEKRGYEDMLDSFLELEKDEEVRMVA